MIGHVAADDGGARPSFLAAVPSVMRRAREVFGGDPPLTDGAVPLIAATRAGGGGYRRRRSGETGTGRTIRLLGRTQYRSVLLYTDKT